MPITGWNCPICHRPDQPLDHFADTKCGLGVHPDYTAAILHSNDDRYTTSAVTVSGALGCPRSRAIEESCEVSVNPLDYNALLIGTAWDRHLAKWAPPTESKVLVKGVIAGIEVTGEIDRLRYVDGYYCIEDHKHGNNFQQKFVAKDGPKAENIIQTSLYAELYEQSFRIRPTHGILWYHFSGSAKAANSPLMPFVYLLWDLPRCLEYQPFNGDYTVEQLLKQSARYEASKVGQGVQQSALELPLVGTTMSFGSAEFCDYCQVRAVCMTAARGAPF